MRMSTIAKHAETGAGSAFARILGAELRRRRRELGLSQALVGHPLTRAYISSLEGGRMTPSLASLLMIAQRLNSSAAVILASVEAQLEDLANRGSRNETSFPR